MRKAIRKTMKTKGDFVQRQRAGGRLDCGDRRRESNARGKVA